MRGSYIHGKTKPAIGEAARRKAPDYYSQVLANLRVGLSFAGVAIVLNQHSMSTTTWKLSPKGDYDDDVQQALSDNSVDAAPNLSHPTGSQKDILVTVLAGGASGAVAKTAMAPFSRLTILYQVQALQPAGGKAPGLLAALKQVIRQEGALSLWKGNLATIIHRVPYSAANFTVFEYTKKALNKYCDSDVARRLIAGAMSGLVACTAAYPLDLVRTRLAAQRDMLPHATRLTEEAASHLGMQVDTTRPTSATQLPNTLKPPKNYRSIRHALKCIVGEEGVRGLYRGLHATLLQVTPTLALNFALYDSFKAMYLRSYVSCSNAAASGDSSSWASAAEMQTKGAHSSSSSSSSSSNSSSNKSKHADNKWVSTEVTPTVQQQHVHNRSDSVTSSTHAAPASGVGHDSTAIPQGHGTAITQGHGTAAQRQMSCQPKAQQQGAVQLSVVDSLVCAASSGFITSTVTFPLDVVRKQLQTNRAPQSSTSFTKTFSRVWQQRGIRGFYSGIVPEYCKVLPGMAIAFGMYEGIRSAFGVPPS